MDSVFSSLWANVSKVTSLKDCSFRVFSKCICHCHCLCICICLCIAEKVWKSGSERLHWSISCDPTEKMPVHKSEIWYREIQLVKIKKSISARGLQKRWRILGGPVFGRLWQHLWRKFTFQGDFWKVHAPLIPNMCPTWVLQCIFFTLQASEVEIWLF